MLQQVFHPIENQCADPKRSNQRDAVSGKLAMLISAAVRAPSGDNTQPWRFKIDAKAGRITVAVDETRDPSPMNAGQRMARIAAGAALENILRTAQHNHWDAEPHTEAEGAII